MRPLYREESRIPVSWNKYTTVRHNIENVCRQVKYLLIGLPRKPLADDDDLAQLPRVERHVQYFPRKYWQHGMF